VSQLAIFGASLVASLLIGWPLSAALNKFRILDRPKERSSHVVPTPRGGGIGIISVVIFTIVAFIVLQPNRLKFAIIIVVFLVSFVSLIDDIRGVSAVFRFLTQTIAAVILVGSFDFNILGIEFFSDKNLLSLLRVLKFSVFVFLIVGYTNAFNFMDGINGLAAMQAGVGGLAMAIVVGVSSWCWDSPAVLVLLSISGAAFGFLPHNFPNARMFMGDVGSAPLGMIFAAISIWVCCYEGYNLLVPIVIINVNFIIDTSVTLLRRIYRGDNWLEPHCEHFYQKLVRSGLSHAQVTRYAALLLTLTSLMAICIVHEKLEVQLALLTFVLVLWGVFYRLSEVRFKRRTKLNLSR